MKQLKKILAILLIAAMTLCFFACDSSSSKDDDDDDKTEESSKAESSDEASSKEESSKEESSEAESSKEESSEAESSEEESSEAESSEAESSETESSKEESSEVIVDADTIEGKYMLYSMTVDGEEYGYDMVILAEVDDSYLEFYDDGTVDVYFTDEEVMNGEYDLDAGTITVDGEAIELSVKGEKATISMDGEDMIFVIAGSDLFDEVDVSVDVSVDFGDEDIVGKYLLYAMTTGEEFIDYSTIKEIGYDSAYIELKEDGTFIMVFPEVEPEEGTYDAETMILTDSIGDEIAFEVMEGILTIENEEDVFAFVIEGDELFEIEDPDYSVEMNEDEDIVGKYFLYEIESGEEYIDYETIKEIGYDSAYIELKEDGTFFMEFPEVDPEEGTYDAETMILTDSIGDEIEFDVFAGMLFIDIDEDSFTFVIEGDILLD